MTWILLAILGNTQDAELDRWLEKLQRGTIEEREEASRHLRKHGKPSVDRLRKALQDSQDPEFQARLREILESLTTVQLDLVKAISFPDKRPERIVWRPDGRQVAVGGGEAEEIAVYDTESWEAVHRLKTDAPLLDFAFSPSSGRFAVQTLKGITVGTTNSYETASSLRENMGFRAHDGFSPSVRFLRDDALVFSSSTHNECHRETRVELATVSDRLVFPVELPLGGVFCSGSFNLSPKGTFLLLNGSSPGTLRVVQPAGWKEVANPALRHVNADKKRGGVEFGNLRVFSPRESFLATTGFDLYLTVYETQTWKEKRTWKPNGTPRSFGFTHDEKYLLTVGDDQTVRIWRCDDFKELGSVRLPRSGLILPSPATNLVLIGYPESEHRFFDVLERIEIYRVREP